MPLPQPSSKCATNSVSSARHRIPGDSHKSSPPLLPPHIFLLRRIHFPFQSHLPRFIRGCSHVDVYYHRVYRQQQRERRIFIETVALRFDILAGTTGSVSVLRGPHPCNRAVVYPCTQSSPPGGQACSQVRAGPWILAGGEVDVPRMGVKYVHQFMTRCTNGLL